MLRKRLIVVVFGAVFLVATACSSNNNNNTASSYKPVTRHIEMATIQELISEFGNIPGLKDEIGSALKSGGPMEGHEVYAWYPSSLTAYEGDTIDITIHNGQGDEHIFNLPDLGIVNQTIPPDGTISVSIKASKLGSFQYFCSVPEHMPWMQGFLTVLPDSDAG